MPGNRKYGTTTTKKKRHPTIKNGVVMGSGAIALGDIIINDGARIGAGSVVIKSVPPGATVVGIPGRIVENLFVPSSSLEHGQLPDPVTETINLLLMEQEDLRQRLSKLESSD